MVEAQRRGPERKDRREPVEVPRRPPLAQLRPVRPAAPPRRVESRNERMARQIVEPIASQFLNIPEVKGRMRREGWQLGTLLG